MPHGIISLCGSQRTAGECHRTKHTIMLPKQNCSQAKAACLHLYHTRPLQLSICNSVVFTSAFVRARSTASCWNANPTVRSFLAAWSTGQKAHFLAAKDSIFTIRAEPPKTIRTTTNTPPFNAEGGDSSNPRPLCRALSNAVLASKSLRATHICFGNDRHPTRDS